MAVNVIATAVFPAMVRALRSKLSGILGAGGRIVADIVDQLREFRQRHGLTQEQVARSLDVSVVTVNRWENRRSAPSARLACRIGQLISHSGQVVPPRVIRQLVPRSGPLVPFTGRSRELADLLSVWPRQQLLTLTGPGGIGKSRLAGELLQRSGQLPLATVELAAVPEPALVPAEIAAVLGLRVPSGPRAVTMLAAALRDAEGVLLLDGCEHVTGPLHGLLRDLAARARNLTVLATSRIPLQVQGERIWPVSGLNCPAEDGVPSGRVAESDAVQFFLSRTGADGGGQPLVAEPARLIEVGRLCRLLGGVPLTLSLIASRTGALSLDELIIYWEEHARLLADPATRYERHQIIGSAIEWSAALLGQDDRRLLGDLSVFAGSFGTQEAQAVHPDLSGTALQAGLDRLVTLSWVTPVPSTGEQQYGLPRPLRDWAYQELARGSGTGPAYRRHALYVRDLGRQAETNNFAVGSVDWPERLDRAVGDIQSALHWSSAADATLGTEIATSLLSWWRASGRATAGRHWLRACRSSASGLPGRWAARAACAEALLAVDQGAYEEAELLASSALPVLEAAGDTRWLGRALMARSLVARHHGQAEAARQSLNRAFDYQAGCGDLDEMAMSLDSLGRLEADLGHLRRARGFFRHCLSIRRELGDDRLTATALASLAEVMTRDKAHARARVLLDEAKALADRVADSHIQAVVTLGLAENALGGKGHQTAISHFRAARDHATAAGSGHLLALAVCGLGRALCAPGQDADGRNLLQLSKKLATQLGDQVVIGQAQDALQAVTRTGTAPKLTRRETDVIRLVNKGESDWAIAEHLGISVPTVRRHLENIFAKLNTRRRGSAAAIWRNMP